MSEVSSLENKGDLLLHIALNLIRLRRPKRENKFSKELFPQGIITWSALGKRNLKAKGVYS